MNTLILLLATGIGNQPAPAPLQCANPTAAKGDVKGGPPIVHAFELVHNGTGTLSITRVEAGCGCLRQSLTAKVLQPGERSSLTIDVNSLTQPDGPNRWQILVGYKVEAPGVPQQTGELLLQITATLSREVSVSPPQLGFSTSGIASQQLTITDTRAKPLTVVKAGASSPHLAVEVGAREAGKGQVVTVKLAAEAPPGHTDEIVTLLTDDPAYPELRVPVRVLKRPAGAVAATPDSVVVRFAAGQTEVSTLVQLRAADGKPVGVFGAESDHPGVTVKWSPGSGSVAVVRVTVTESAAAQPGSCKVRVKLTDAGGPEVVIPVGWTGAKK
ncbi:MAG: DUF1573 domain-containing protein [Planctomycetes bacterium]|nr:DUF1573 domain-containing protein [Planctomycetota bacterium]